jgi:2-C-methyl-D-erythritol 4-phosphate cytidylyltransferase
MLDFFNKKSSKSDSATTCAILVAAGSGSRMRTKTSKYLLEILGRPIISYTLDVFQNAKCIDEIIIVTRHQDIVAVGDIVQSFAYDKVKCILAGGKTRQESVQIGLQQLSDQIQTVCIHDGVRPFVTEKQLETCMDAARKHGAAVLAVLSKDTLKSGSEDGFISGDISRENTYQIQTPQCFTTDVIKDAYLHAEEEKRQATDDSTLVVQSGGTVKLIEGSYDNVKITTPEDLLIAECILRKRGELFENW